MSSRFRLRYQAIDLALSEREFVVGRTVGCDLVVDDALVSRRHASFRVNGDNVELSDLGSRNGVTVNGKRVQGTVTLETGDRVTIGSQELVLQDVMEQRDLGTTELVRCPGCGTFLEPTQSCRTCTATTKLPKIQARGNDENAAPGSNALGSSRLAEKALSLGRFDEAERLLAAMLANVLQRASNLEDGQQDALKSATSYALRLAEGLHKPSWLDYPFELYATAKQLMPAEIIEELYRVAARVRYVNPHAVRRYLTALRAIDAQWAANERFLLQRLEGLERRIVSG
jgi:pSer/pThr/pTyr-binding forkhead associated (FHA) protein